jgi:hypothetical protein
MMLGYLLVGLGLFLMWKSTSQMDVLDSPPDYRYSMPGGKRVNHSGFQRNPSFSNTSQPDVKK